MVLEKIIQYLPQSGRNIRHIRKKKTFELCLYVCASSLQHHPKGNMTEIYSRHARIATDMVR